MNYSLPWHFFAFSLLHHCKYHYAPCIWMLASFLFMICCTKYNGKTPILFNIPESGKRLNDHGNKHFTLLIHKNNILGHQKINACLSRHKYMAASGQWPEATNHNVILWEVFHVCCSSIWYCSHGCQKFSSNKVFHTSSPKDLYNFTIIYVQDKTACVISRWTFSN